MRNIITERSWSVRRCNHCIELSVGVQSSDRCYVTRWNENTEKNWSINTDKSTLQIASFVLSLSLQEVGPNTSGDVRGLRQQDTGAWTFPPIHPTALDYGAASILWHSDEEPAAQRAALTSHPVGCIYLMPVPFVFGSQREPWTNSRCYGWTRWSLLCLKTAVLNPKTSQETRRGCSLLKTSYFVWTVTQVWPLCLLKVCAVIDFERHWNDHASLSTLRAFPETSIM